MKQQLTPMRCLDMRTEQITIEVDPRAAEAFRSASDDERRKLEVLLSLRILEATSSSASLEEVISEVSRNAQQRGLTPPILDSILSES